MHALLGKKLMMTQLYNDKGEVMPVTIIQAGPVHTGLTDDPARELVRLMQILVLPVGWKSFMGSDSILLCTRQAKP